MIKKLLTVFIISICLVGCGNKDFTLKDSKNNLSSITLQELHGAISSEGKMITLNVDGKETNVLGYEFLLEDNGKTIKTFITFNNNEEYKIGDRLDYNSTMTDKYIIAFAGDKEAINVMYFD